MKEFKNAQSKINMGTNTGRLVKTAEDKKVNNLKKAKNKEPTKKNMKINENENIYNINNNNNSLGGNDEYQIYRPNNYVVSNVVYENDNDYSTYVHHDNSKNDNDLVLPKITNNKLKNDVYKTQNNNKLMNKSNSTNKIMTKQKIKDVTPSSNEINNLLPRNNVDHIKENKKLVSEDLIPSRAKKVDKKNEEFYEHNNYGKVPD